ncbi:cytochrome c oxidase subunit 4 [Dermatophilaceae bacterium Soc4.6]
MKVEYKLFLYLGIFFAPLGPIYYLWEKSYGGDDLVGFIALMLTALLALLVAFYLRVTARQFTDRPEDNPRALISEQEGDYGFFTPYSWWPLWLGASAAIVFAGLAIGWWLFIIGVSFGVVAICGWTFEHFKGEYAN